MKHKTLVDLIKRAGSYGHGIMPQWMVEQILDGLKLALEHTTDNEQAIENEIQAKGLDAPRLNPAMIDAAITSEAYHVFPGTTLTVCCLVLRNGFTVTGKSAAASPENFDVEIGRKIARQNAREKIWPLEGYLLKEKLSAMIYPI